jgi:predicted transglutaminase-like cysteine proteinase
LPAACGGLHPAAKKPDVNDGLNHQPTTFQQMEKLVTPEDPAVIQAIYDAVNAPSPVAGASGTSTVINGITHYSGTFSYTPDTSSNLQRIIDWATAHCAYTLDQVNYGVQDYWATPAEALERGSGDCEDYAILLCSLLRAYGVPADEVYVAVGSDPYANQHSWVEEKYYTGVWRMLDTQQNPSSQPPVFGTEAAGSYTTDYCFNDTIGFNGPPALPAGLYEFESTMTAYPSGAGSSNSYTRYVNAGQKITAQVNWLPYTVDWPFNADIVLPWSFNVYDDDGNQVFGWSGTDIQKTIEYTPVRTGIYRIEIVKRDGMARPVELTLDPQQGWTTGTPLPIDLMRVENAPLPAAASYSTEKKPNEAAPPVTQEPTPTVTAPLIVPQDELVQHTLDVINAQIAKSIYPPYVLGTNAAAQQHANDMLAHDFASPWGTDGSTPNERYDLAGGTGYQSEVDYRTALNWNGDPASFATALLAAIDHDLPTSGFSVFSGNGVVYNPSLFELQPDRANIGIAYNGQYLYMVVQYESFYMTYDQPPSIYDGVLSFAGRYASGAVIEDIKVAYQPLPAALTSAQISYGSYIDYDGQDQADFNYYHGILDAMIPSAPTVAYFDPHWVPLDFPPIDQTGLNLQSLIPMPQPGYHSLNRLKGLTLQGDTFSFTYDLGNLIPAGVKGVYTISLDVLFPGGFVSPLSSYSIFVG